jgi:hypothetical protein
VPSTHWMILRKLVFLEQIVFFDTTPISHFFGASFSVHEVIQHKNACFLVSVDRYALHCISCKIWRCVVYLGSEKWVTLHKKLGGSNPISFQKLKLSPFNPRRSEKGQIPPLGKSPTFLESHIFCERDRQPAFKFRIASEVLLIYRRMPKKLSFLAWNVFLIPFQSFALLGLLIAFTDSYNTKVLVPGY